MRKRNTDDALRKACVIDRFWDPTTGGLAVRLTLSRLSCNQVATTLFQALPDNACKFLTISYTELYLISWSNVQWVQGCNTTWLSEPWRSCIMERQSIYIVHGSHSCSQMQGRLYDGVTACGTTPRQARAGPLAARSLSNPVGLAVRCLAVIAAA